METYREIVGCGRELVGPLAAYFDVDPDEGMIWRTYLIYYRSTDHADHREVPESHFPGLGRYDYQSFKRRVGQGWLTAAALAFTFTSTSSVAPVLAAPCDQPISNPIQCENTLTATPRASGPGSADPAT
jgi:hypothetical protein